ncbi:cytochrome c biogenesis protein CcsA [Tenacibaculum ovolyticum]|uniref:cytochrome c biogenesis protein CcsA n=1 Tax=Tenacibaculum ovolyticum TaxID=104270 RepID=UPI00040B7FE2|nr:cytochrome c biogenesis protein CcsA [Tenacibaculum ovolyticum]
MKKILDILYSTRLTAVLFFLFAVAMGVATFIENDFGTQTSKALVYNTWWFELIMLFFVVNFFGNIFRYRLFRKEKWGVLLFHASFLLILIGAGVTRYISHEGIMIIDEGETTNTFFSDTNYLNVIVDNNKFQKETNNELLLSAWGSNSAKFTETFQPNKNETQHNITFKLVEYIPWSEEKLVLDENGIEHLFLVESSSGSRHEHYIKRGTTQNIHNILVSFDVSDNNASVNFFYEDGNLKMISKDNGDWLRMADQKRGQIVKDSAQHFQLLTLHTIKGLQFVIPKSPEKGIMKTLSGKKDDKKYDTVIFDITANGETKRVNFYGGKFNVDNIEEFNIGDLNFRAWYGAKKLQTPFNVKLNDFQLEKYPGSESAAAYASEITVIEEKETFDFRIFMNNILDYKGYKLFQSSYKIDGDHEQTHLSVNHDFIGTWITYIGYFLLFFGLICILFIKNTRFDDLKKALNKVKAKKASLSVIILLLSLNTIGQEHEAHKPKQFSESQIDSILTANKASIEHATKFSSLVIQDVGGRMKPTHTLASELLRKVAHTNNFKGLNPTQVLLSITEMPMLWLNVPFIYLEKGNPQIRELLGVSKDTKYAKFIDFYDDKGTSIIGKRVVEAQKKKIKSKFDTDIIKIEQRVWLLSQTLGGGMLRIYPIPNDENNKWVSQPETLNAGFKGTDSVFVRQSLPVYMQLLQSSKKSGDYTETNKVLDGIKKFQKKFGKEVYPSEDKVELEIAYNKFNVFNRLIKYYGLSSILLIIFLITQILSSKKWINYIVKALIVFIIAFFILHTLGLLSRWYISGSAPWSNAYEAIVFVAWATMLFGLLLGRKSTLTIAAATFITAITMFFASLNWLDPEIANLQPVLNSWWLKVHVSIIVGSYGPFSLGMILGIFTLFLMIFTNSKNKKKMDLHIKELTIINEMSITVGLVMLTIGTFLGGMWANESWGRYWGWDPKETWALISIMVYAFVLHMRLIPGLRGRYTFNLWSIIAYASIMMTFMGVNFYLSGLHSYASGDKVITPTSVYYSIAFVFILGLFAWFKYKKFYKK